MQETKEMTGEKSEGIEVVFLLAFSRPDGSRRGIPGIEPGTSRTLSENHTARPNPHHSRSSAVGNHRTFRYIFVW